MKRLTLRLSIYRFKYLLNVLVISLSVLSLVGCDSASKALGGGLGIGAAIAVFGGAGGPASAGVVLAAGGENQKPALLLPFTAEVAALAIRPNGETLYAADRFHNTVSVIDIRKDERRTVAVLDAGTGPRFIAVTPKDGQLLLVSNFGTGTQDFNPTDDLSESIFSDGRASDRVRVINTQTFETVKEVTVGKRPLAIAIKPDDSKAYVANMESENVSVIDLFTFDVGSVTLSGDTNGSSTREIIPVSTAITNDGTKVLVVSILLDEFGNIANKNAIVDIIDTELDESIASIEIGPSDGPPFNGIAIHPEDTVAYVTNPSDDSFSIIDLSDIDNLPAEAEKVTFNESVAGTNGPGPLVFSIDGTRAYVAFPPKSSQLCPATAPGELAIINTSDNTVLQEGIEVGEAAIGLVITEDGSKVYTITGCEDQTTLEGKVTRIDTTDDEILGNDIKTIDKIRSRATAVTIGLGSEDDPAEVFVALPDAIAVIDTATDTVVNEGIPVRGYGPTKLSMDDKGGTRLFAIHPGTDKVSVTELDASGGTLLGTVPVGNRPSSLLVEVDRVIVGNAGFSRTPDNLVSVFETNVNLSAPVVEELDIRGDPIDINEPLDINSDCFGIGRGLVDLKFVDIASKGPSIITANFGDFFPNNRRPGNSFTLIQDFLNTREIERTDLDSIDNFCGVSDNPWPIEITQPFESGGKQFIYILDFDLDTRGQIFPFEIGAIDTEFPISTETLPASAEILGNNLYVVNYKPQQQTISIDEFDLGVDPKAPDQDTIDIKFELPKTSSSATNAGKLKILDTKKIAFVLHGGDRSFECDQNLFCEIGNIVSLTDLDTPTNQAFITVGQRPTDIAFSNDETKALVTNYFDGTVSIIDTGIDFNDPEKTADKTLFVGDGPTGIEVWDSKAYVANSVSNSISVIPIEQDIADITQESIQTIPLN